jgi:hypothetical protein
MHSLTLPPGLDPVTRYDVLYTLPWGKPLGVPFRFLSLSQFRSYNDINA